MKKIMNRVKGCVVTCVAVGILFNSLKVDARTLAKSYNDTLRLHTVNDYLATSWSIVNIFSSGEEQYKWADNKNVIFGSRRLYVTFKETTSAHAIKYLVTPIYHKTQSGDLRFSSWETESAISGNVNYVYNKKNGKNVTYKYNSGNKAVWSVGIGTEDDAIVPIVSQAHEMSLNIKLSTGK